MLENTLNGVVKLYENAAAALLQRRLAVACCVLVYTNKE